MDEYDLETALLKALLPGDWKEIDVALGLGFARYWTVIADLCTGTVYISGGKWSIKIMRWNLRWNSIIDDEIAGKTFAEVVDWLRDPRRRKKFGLPELDESDG